jgi:hypothetical protein
VDRLHEDLNRVKVKPYVEEKDYDGSQDDAEAAGEAWAGFKQRNDSILVDQMYGQMKSVLTCPVATCGKVSVKYDPFSTATLPVPRGKKRHITVVLAPTTHPLPSLHPATDEDREGDARSRFTRRFTRYSLTVDAGGQVADVVNALAEESGCGGGADCLLLLEILPDGSFWKYIDERTALEKVREEDVLVAYHYTPSFLVKGIALVLCYSCDGRGNKLTTTGKGKGAGEKGEKEEEEEDSDGNEYESVGQSFPRLVVVSRGTTTDEFRGGVYDNCVRGCGVGARKAVAVMGAREVAREAGEEEEGGAGGAGGAGVGVVLSLDDVRGDYDRYLPLVPTDKTGGLTEESGWLPCGESLLHDYMVDKKGSFRHVNIMWDEADWEVDADAMGGCTVDHESFTAMCEAKEAARGGRGRSGITLGSCLERSGEPEKLGANDQW